MHWFFRQRMSLSSFFAQSSTSRLYPKPSDGLSPSLLSPLQHLRIVSDVASTPFTAFSASALPVSSRRSLSIKRHSHASDKFFSKTFKSFDKRITKMSSEEARNVKRKAVDMDQDSNAPSATEGAPAPTPANNAAGNGATTQAVDGKGSKKAKNGKDQGPNRNHLLNMAAKDQDARVALQIFDESLASPGQPPLTLQQLSVVISILAGSEGWEAKVRGRKESSSFHASHTGPEARCPEVFARVRAESQRSGQAVPEVIYTGMARAAALRGDGEEALRLVSELLSSPSGPSLARLRSFHPALLCRALEGRWQEALEVEGRIRELGLEPGETEYQYLLEACVVGSAPEASVRSLLMRLAEDVVSLSPRTLDLLEAWFGGEAARGVFSEGGRLHGKASSWVLSRESVGPDGKCSAGQLAAVDLTPEEYGKFLEGIAKLAMEREKHPNDFKSFVEWSDRHGPHHVIIDGANVALFGQSTSGLQFQWPQVQKTVAAFRASHPDKKPLVLLHNRRLRTPESSHPDVVPFIEELRRKKELYATPVGSNDDWYWLYACVKAGAEGLLVSNDEMRDHIFQLLKPKYFLKWKQRHQTKYSFTPFSGPHVFIPPIFTACVQELEGGAWVFPVEGEEGKFLVARPSADGN